jgi:N-hydroxyarylamine O-acetyltransferase
MKKGRQIQQMKQLDIERYLKRIKYSGKTTPEVKVLTGLQYAHLMTVPFENLDIQNKVKIEIEDSYNKIVNSNRGGFCYELNSSFYQLLKGIGFDVKIVSARVFSNDTGKFGPEFDHMAIIANVQNKEYLVDVGFGDFTLHPLKFILNRNQRDPRGVFRIEKFDDTYFVVKKRNSSKTFTEEYIFSAKERGIDEFRKMCRFHQTSKKSHFTRKLVCSLPTDEGRITITGNTLKVTKNGTVTERALKSYSEIRKVLLGNFNIKLAPK